MSSILELESEIHPPDAWEYHARAGGGRPWVVRVHTQSVAYGHGPQIVLRIEQRCFLRSGAEARGQNWIKPRIMVDPCANTEEEALARVTAIHENFLEYVRMRMEVTPADADLMTAEV